eukprot:gene10430-3206_t
MFESPSRTLRDLLRPLGHPNSAGQGSYVQVYLISSHRGTGTRPSRDRPRAPEGLGSDWIPRTRSRLGPSGPSRTGLGSRLGPVPVPPMTSLPWLYMRGLGISDAKEASEHTCMICLDIVAAQKSTD